eukprot:scaffold254426_cov45-Prasinocladus_malaysianus.AAC.1
MPDAEALICLAPRASGLTRRNDVQTGRRTRPSRRFTPSSLLAFSENVHQHAFFNMYSRLESALLGKGSTSLVYAVTRRAQGDNDGDAAAVQVRSRTRTVYACKDVLIDRQRIGAGGRTPQAVCDELNLMLSLQHPNIISLVDYFIDNLSAKMVFEYLPGGDLVDVISERGSLVEEDARGITTNVLKALSYMHANGVVHRDIKLENVLRVNDYSLVDVKVIDLGMAVRLTSDPQQLTISGSP